MSLVLKLAGQLTGFEIDVYRESDEDGEDIDIEEFADEIENDIIDALKAIGCDTAKSVLALTKDDLLRRTELDEKVIEKVFTILNTEFEEEES